MLNQLIRILVVEDDDVDSEALVRAFRYHKVANPVQRVRNGQEALQVLRGGAGHSRLTHPCIILTDLNMPGMDGLGLLQALRADPMLKRHVVFVLSTSERDEDIVQAYDLQVAGYFTKHTMAADFAQVIQLLDVYQPSIHLPPPDGDV